METKTYPVQFDFSDWGYAYETDSAKITSIITGKSIRIRKARVTFNEKVPDSHWQLLRGFIPKCGEGRTYCSRITAGEMRVLLSLSNI